MILFVWLAPYFYHLPSPYGLSHGEYSFDISLEMEGNVSFGVYVGFFDILTLGASYGGEGILGEDSVRFLPYPSFYISANLIHEDILPAITVGFENRGYNWERGVAQVEPQGLFSSASKRFYFNLVETTLSGGVSIRRSPGFFFYGDIVYIDVGGIFTEITIRDGVNLDAGFLISSEENQIYFAFEDILNGKFRRSLKIGVLKYF